MSIKTSRLGKKSYKSRISGGKSLSSKDSETTMWFDVCPQGCTVFIGKYEHDYFCPKCNHFRFLKCIESKCKRIFGNSKCLCGNSHKRVGKKRLFYRPFIAMVHKLLSTRGFLDLLNYHPVILTSYKCNDFKHGSIYQKHERDNNNIFLAWKAAEPLSREKYKHVFLALGFFYDGGK
jgi:hypothetical protein